MRVTSLIDSLAFGGAERSLVELSPQLRAQDIDHRIVVLYDRPGYTEEARDHGTIVDVIESSTRRRLRALRGVLADTDLLHTTLYESDILGRTAALGTRVPVVCTLANVRYGAAQRDEPGVSTWKLRSTQALDVVTARRVQHFHAVSEAVADAMAPALRVSRTAVTVVPRGRDAARLGRRTTERRRLARVGLDLEDRHEVVLAVARHEHQKGLDVLVDSVARLRPRHPHLRVLVAGGEGRRTGDLRDAIRSAGLDAVITLLGARNDVPELLNAADVFALPSRREGFPGALVEAMALEAPIVVSDIPMNREAVPDGSFALFAPVGDANALAERIDQVLADGPAAAQRAQRAYERFASDFALEAVARRMAHLFRDAGAPTRRASAA